MGQLLTNMSHQNIFNELNYGDFLNDKEVWRYGQHKLFQCFPKSHLFPKVERMSDLQMDVEELDEKAEKSRSKIQNLELTEGTIRKLSQFVAACLL